MAGLSVSQQRLVWLRLTLKALDKELELESLNDRIELQKLVYLAQAATETAPYEFNPYIRGPYSPSLTRDLYYLLEPEQMYEIECLGASFRLKESTVSFLNKAKLIANEKHGEKRIRWLELVASMHQKHIETGADYDRVWQEVQEWKRNIFSEREASDAWSSLVHHGLVAT